MRVRSMNYLPCHVVQLQNDNWLTHSKDVTLLFLFVITGAHNQGKDGWHECVSWDGALSLAVREYSLVWWLEEHRAVNGSVILSRDSEPFIAQYELCSDREGTSMSPESHH